MRRMLTVICLLAAGCSTQSTEPTEDFRTGVTRDPLVLLTAAVEAREVMEALYTGRVVADSAGCLRLDSPEPATVVWPKGFSLGSSIEGPIVRNAAGVEIGRVGAPFEFGGGYVNSLEGIAAISVETRRVARERCPGQYWIVGDIN